MSAVQAYLIQHADSAETGLRRIAALHPMAAVRFAPCADVAAGDEEEAAYSAPV